MSVKLLMKWDIKQEQQQEYFEFVVREWGPGLNRLGVELIGRVPATLHTPLMSATNAIHGIVVIGGMVVLGMLAFK